MKWLLILAPLAVGLLAAIAFVVIAGALMPRTHSATRSVRLAAAPEAVWAIITDFASHPAWRPGVRGMERLPDRDGCAVWSEKGGWGEAMTMVVETFEPPGRMVTRIADDGLPFGGAWTYEITPEDAGCRVRITEDGFIGPGAFRYVARTMGHAATIERYLRALGRKLGQPVRIES